jgi:hypothetical protein
MNTPTHSIETAAEAILCDCPIVAAAEAILRDYQDMTVGAIMELFDSEVKRLTPPSEDPNLAELNTLKLLCEALRSQIGNADCPEKLEEAAYWYGGMAV